MVRAGNYKPMKMKNLINTITFWSGLRSLGANPLHVFNMICNMRAAACCCAGYRCCWSSSASLSATHVPMILPS